MQDHKVLHLLFLSVFQRVGDGGHHTQFLYVRSILVAVFNLKLPLSGSLYLSQLTFACLGKLFGSLLGILDSFGHHLEGCYSRWQHPVSTILLA